MARWMAGLGVVVLCGCPQPEPEPDPDPGTDPDPVGIGPDGGEVSGDCGRIVVPAGALDDHVDITVSSVTVDAAPEAHHSLVSAVCEFAPLGTSLSRDARFEISHSSGSDHLVLLRLDDADDDTWEVVDASMGDGLAMVRSDQFAYYAVAERIIQGPCDPENFHRPLADYRIADARDAYEACLDAEPDNGGAHFGAGLTHLMLLPDWDVISGPHSWCDVENNWIADWYGSDGYLAHLNGRYEGDASLGVTYKADSSASPVEVDVFPTTESVLTEIDDYGDGDRVYLSVDSRLDYSSYLSVGLFADDVYSDGSRVALEEGLQLDVARLVGGYSLRLRPECELLGSRCSESFAPDSVAGGTIDVVQYGGRGGVLELRFDAVLPAGCETNRDCEATYHLTGTVEDEIDEYFEPENLPFEDGTPICDDNDCDDYEAFTIISDLCDVPDYMAANDVAAGLVDELTIVSDHLHAASKQADLRYSLPRDNIVLIRDDAVFSQTDAMAVAASVDLLIFGLDFSAQYTYLDPESSPDLDVHRYDGHRWNWRDDTCDAVELLGIPEAQLVADLETWLAEPVAGADWTVAELAFRDVFETIHAAGQAQPQTVGVLDFSARGAEDYVDATLADIDAVVDSMDDTAIHSLPSAPEFEFQFGAFFNDVPVRDSILAASGVDRFLFIEGEECDAYLDAELPVAEWGAHGAGALVLSDDVLDGYYTIPAVFDEDLFEATLDGGDVPVWINRSALENLAVWED